MSARWLAALLALLVWYFPLHAMAAPDAVGATVEFAVWRGTLKGTVGAKPVSVSLQRTAGRVSGTYCYEPCSEKTRFQLGLAGTIAGSRADLAERDRRPGTPDGMPTGRWRLEWRGDAATGTWTAPDGRRTLPVTLRAAAPFPFEIRLVADTLPGGDDDCEPVPYVTAIRLYRAGRLVQALPTDSQANCGLFLPAVVDANFDGLPDLTLALTMPAGPNTPFQTWLFDPGTRRFVDAPPLLQEIAAPEYDAAHKTVVTSWRNGCCEHGVATYRWNGGTLEETASETSSVLPVLVNGKRRYCYAVPGYSDGRIEFEQRVEQSGGRLVLSFDDFSDCAATLAIQRPVVDVWQRDQAGMLRRVRSETMRWQRVETPGGVRYCPDVPFFTQGRIERVVLRDDPDTACTDTPP